MRKIAILILVMVNIAFGMDPQISDLVKEHAREAIKDGDKSAKPLIIDTGFGEKFNYKEFLNPDSSASEKNYKKRLRAFRRYLFDYIDNVTQATGTGQSESSGSKYNFLGHYLFCVATLCKNAPSIPKLRGQPIFSVIPSHETKRGTLTSPLKDTDIPLNYELPCSVNASQIIVHPQKYALDTGTAVVMPYMRRHKGRNQLGTTAPLFILTEPDEESIAFNFCQLNHNNASIVEKFNFVKSFDNLALSDQAKRILNVGVFQIAGESLDFQIKNRKEKNANALELNKEDQAVVDRCCYSCPHLLSLKLAEQKALTMERNFLNLTADNVIILDKKQESLCNEIASLINAYPALTAEYLALYKRVLTDLKEDKSSKDTAEALPVKELSAPIFVKTVPQKISYAQRVLRWFKDGFLKGKSNSSIFYHTVLPLVADPFVMQHGTRAEYNNKTYPGQKDNQYKIAGKIIDEKTNEEVYCVFNVCLDPKGICYHRDCKKSNWNALAADMKNDIEVEDEKYDFQPHEDIKAAPGVIVQESPVSVSVNNPAHNCKIVLYKNSVNK